MTREELKAHCKRQIEGREMWAKHRGEEPSGKVYEEHKLILELLEQEPCNKYIKEIDHLRKYISKLETQIVEQEPYEDCISRQAALRQAINAHKMAQENGFDFKDICEEYLNVLPVVTPQVKCEDIAKAFQLGMAMGFAEKYNSMDRVIEELKKTIATPQESEGSEN